MRLLGASLLKLARRPATHRTFLVVVGLLVVIYLLMGIYATQQSDPALRAGIQPGLEFPGALTTLSQMLLIFGGLAGAAYGGTVAGSEWGWSTFRVALARGESRVRYVVGLFLAVALLALAAWVMLYVVGIGLLLVTAALSGFQTGGLLDPANVGLHLAILVTGWWAVLMEIALAFGVGFVTRSTVAGVAAVMGVTFIELLVGSLVPADLLRLAPITAATNLVTAAAQTGLDAGLGTPLIVTTAYLLLAIGIAAVVARVSEVR